MSSSSVTLEHFNISVSDHDASPIGWHQVNENHLAQFILLQEPCISNWMGGLHPEASLYEFPCSLTMSRRQHLAFRRLLVEKGCIVYSVREVLSAGCSVDHGKRLQLEELAMNSLQYVMEHQSSKNLQEEVDDYKMKAKPAISNILSHFSLSREFKQTGFGNVDWDYFLSEEYKSKSISKMSVDQLIDIVFTRPTVQLKKSDKDTHMKMDKLMFDPLSNLVFCRDQQITTANGVVMCRPRELIRLREVAVMKFCIQKLGIPIIGEIREPGILEGGDFFPINDDLCLIGVGLRSNMYAIEQLMGENILGTNRVAIVKDYFDRSQQRMHLDTIFNIVAPNCCLLLDFVQGSNSPFIRLVDEYQRDSNDQYQIIRHDIEFKEYLLQEGFQIISMTNEMQKRYGINGLNLGNGTFISVDKISSDHIMHSPSFVGTIQTIPFEEVTSMYGSVHCCTQVLSRSSKFSEQKRLALSPNISKRDLDISSQLIRIQNSTEGVDIVLMTLLLDAIASNNILAVMEILEHGIDLTKTNSERRTPLHMACIFGNHDIIQILVEANAPLNAVDIWKNTPLDCARFTSNSAIVKYLQSLGALSFRKLGQNAIVKLDQDLEESNVSMIDNSDKVNSSLKEVEII